jgi:hypothetical protein
LRLKLGYEHCWEYSNKQKSSCAALESNIITSCI